MAFIYDVTTNRGKVRLMVADTDSGNILLQDDEIDFFIETEANIYFAAAMAAAAISAQYYRLATNKKVGDLSRSYESKAEDYKQLQSDLKERGKSKPSTNIVTPKFGGTSISAKTSNDNNEDLVQSRFKRGQFNYNKNVCDDSDDCC